MSEKELAALKRESSDLLLKKTILQEKRKVLKQLAEQHRDDIPSLEKDSIELDAIINEDNDIMNRVLVINGILNENKPIVNEDENKGATRMYNSHNKYEQFKNDMRAVDAVSTAEYRSAWFKTISGRDTELTDIEKRAMSTVNNVATVPTITIDLIMGRLLNEGTLRSAVSIYNIPNLLSIPIEDVVNDAEWIGEGASGSIKTDTTKNIVLAKNKLMRFISMTIELSTMSISALETWIVDRMVKKMSIAIEKSIAEGTGALQPTGIVNGTTWVDDANQITVATALTYDDFVDLEGLISEEYITDSVYLMDRANLGKVRKLKDLEKRPLFTREVEDGFVGYIGGIRVMLSRHMNGIYLGSWKSVWVGNIISPLELAISTEAGFMSGDSVYRGLMLFDGKPTGIKGALARIVTP